jgi:hypothetical protein
MDKEFDIFEKDQDGSMLWRSYSRGYPEAMLNLKEIASRTQNPVYAIHIETKETIAALNVPNPESSPDFSSD